MSKMENKNIAEFQFDGDVTSVYDMIEEMDEFLKTKGLSIKIEDEEHDGYEIVKISDIPNVMFSREDVVKIVDRYAFLLSDNGIPYRDKDGNETCVEWFEKRYPLNE